MNRSLVDRLAKALLYEGYVLYPYRPSVKNAQRWTFGGIYPPAWCEANPGSDASMMQTQCLVVATSQTAVRIIVRFLHLVDRTVGKLETPIDRMPETGEPAFVKVPSLKMNGEIHQSWQEAEEREIDLGELLLSDLVEQTRRIPFDFPAWRTVQGIRPSVAATPASLRAVPREQSDAGVAATKQSEIEAIIIRQQQRVRGCLEISADHIGELPKLTVRILNQTELSDTTDRDNALMHSLASAHTILGVERGQFVSQTDPPAQWKDQSAQCKNIGAWPTLVGESPECDTMLSSPIILYDYPQLAPESPGDLFDSTEIDEILTLRIMTLTDEEKAAAAGVDHRVKELMARTESLAREQLMNLHGTMRGMQPMESNHG